MPKSRKRRRTRSFSARCCSRKGRSTRRSNSSRRRSELAPDDPYVHLELADFLYRLGRLQQAEQEVQAALSNGLRGPDVLSLAARVELGLSNQDEAALARAEQMLQRLVEVRPRIRRRCRRSAG